MEDAAAPALPDAEPPSPLRRALREAPVTLALIAAQVAVFALVTWRLGDTFDPVVQVAAGALERSHVQAGQWWRLLAAVFLHGGTLHLVANSAFGFGWCRIVERVLGHVRFLAVYLVAGVGASAVSLAAHDAISVGASGALFGIIGATLVIHRRLLPGWRPFLRSPSTLSVVVQLAVWTVVAVGFDLNLDHAAHFGGLFFGGATTWLLTRPAPRALTAWTPLALALAAALAGAAWPRPGLSAWQVYDLVDQAEQALARKDRPAAEAALARLDASGRKEDEVELIRAQLAMDDNRLPEAAALARRLATSGETPRIRTAASYLLAYVGYRYYRGQGVEADAVLGYRYIEEACRHGNQEACRAERTIRTGVAPDAGPSGTNATGGPPAGDPPR